MIPVAHHSQYFVPESDIHARIDGVQKILQNQDVAVAWVEHNADLHYFTGSVQSGLLVIPVQGDPLYFVRKSIKRAKVESPLDVQAYPGTKAILQAVRDLVKGRSEKLALSFDVTPSSRYVMLQKQLAGFELLDLSRTIRLLRAVKSDWEIQQIQAAARQAEAIFEQLPEFAHVGQTELELQIEIERRLRLSGHAGTLRLRRPGQELAILMAASGESACYPTNFDGPVGGHAQYPSVPASAGTRHIREGETLIVDIVSSFNGYLSDNARSFYFGSNPPDAVLQAHEFCMECLSRIETQLRPGTNCQQLYQQIDAWAKEQGEPEGFMGYEENRVSFFAHGIGQELDEWPVIANRFDMTLQSGMVLAVEPKAFLSSVGAVGLENTYLVSADGGRSFCSSNRKLRCLD